MRTDAYGNKLLTAARIWRANRASPSKLRGWGVDAGLPALFHYRNFIFGNIKKLCRDAYKKIKKKGNQNGSNGV